MVAPTVANAMASSCLQWAMPNQTNPMHVRDAVKPGMHIRYYYGMHEMRSMVKKWSLG